MEEAPHEELLSGLQSDFPAPQYSLSADDSALQVAVWGEKLVHSFLLQLRDKDADVRAVRWMNGEAESGAPYDFVVRTCDPQHREEVDVFVEVKTTRSRSKAFFEISRQQYDFALQHRHNYHLYRVFNAGDERHVQIIKLVDVAKLLEEKHLRLCMVV